MADPLITPAILGAACAVNLIAGPVGNRADWAVVAGFKKVAGILRQGTHSENQHLMRATQAAYVSAMRSMARSLDEAALDHEERAAAAALKELVHSEAFSAFRFNGEHFPLAETNAEIDRMFSGSFRGAQGISEAQKAYNRSVMADLAVWGVQLPPAFEELFVDGIGEYVPWNVQLRLAFDERIIADREARAIFTVERLGEIRAQGAELIDQVGAFLGRFDRIDQANAEQRAALARIEARLAEQTGVPLPTLREIAREFGELQPDADAAGIEGYLRSKAKEYHRYRDRSEAIEARDNYSRVLLVSAQEAIDAGRFDDADRILADAEAHDGSVARELRLTADQRDIDRSAKRALRGDAAKLRGDYEAAIDHYDVAAAMLPSRAAIDRSYRKCAAAEAAQEWGELIQPDALLISASRWRSLLEETDKNKYWPAWCEMRNRLATTLQAIGSIRGDIAALEEAIYLYKAQFVELKNDAPSNERATAQHNLGVALLNLAEIREGVEIIHEGIASFEAAHEFYTIESYPLDWAMTHNNLGLALSKLYERERGEISLERAIASFRAAQKFYERDSRPLDWAMTQNNLALSLSQLGESRGDASLMYEAINAYQGALQIYKRDQFPVPWATTKSNLGSTFQVLGRMEGNVTLLESAAAAYREALEARNRKSSPFDWATARGNLGRVLLLIAAHTHDVNAVTEAIAALHDVIEVYSELGLASHRSGAEGALVLAQRLYEEIQP